MKESEITLNPNKLVRFLRKPAAEFVKSDIIQFVQDSGIEMINFRYIAEDGRLKTLSFIISSLEHLDSLLTSGERVDGSSLFSFVEAGSSDLYVVPRFRTAFINPFAKVPTLDILCSFYTSEGKPLESAPEYILKKAHNSFKASTGAIFKAMGELEYYIITPISENELYPSVDQKGYHASEPFIKWQEFRMEAMRLISQAGGKIKYGHSEVGNFYDEKYYYEQQEIEFLPVDAEEAAMQLVVAKWILRMLAKQKGILISFAPKITVGKAGSGLHVHFMVEKDGENMMVSNQKLSEIAKKSIAGMLDIAGALTAFGNTIPTSYLRLVPHQEAPTNICWGDRNRSVLVRVPLGWLGDLDMLRIENPKENEDSNQVISKQTAELRSGDGSADIFHYIAGIIIAAQHGLEMKNGLAIADKLYIDVNIFDPKHKDKKDQLDSLPASCWESAIELEKKREIFEKNQIFPKGVIDRFIDMLKSYNDEKLSEELYGKHEDIAQLVEKYIHCQ
ncbi:MAG: glutamine synthetase [Salinivirgaceae bacterium]|nr:glutamine synthetase [Salinivirgaceae bacterium]